MPIVGLPEIKFCIWKTWNIVVGVDSKCFIFSRKKLKIFFVNEFWWILRNDNKLFRNCLIDKSCDTKEIIFMTQNPTKIRGQKNCFQESSVHLILDEILGAWEKLMRASSLARKYLPAERKIFFSSQILKIIFAVYQNRQL